MDSKTALDQITRVRRRELTDLIIQQFGNQVQTGPFAGMTVEVQNKWGDGDVAAKILGCYEQELHDSVETIVTDNSAIVVNVGCAEGFYALGFARRMPGSRVIGIDINEESLQVANTNAINNGTDNVELGTSCTPGELEYLLSEYNTGAVVSDCEGYEMELLDPELVPNLAHCLILVECHDMIVPGVTDALYERFGDTHQITKIKQGARNPYGYECLNAWSDFDKWAVVNEMRGETMHWLFMEPNE